MLLRRAEGRVLCALSRDLPARFTWGIDGRITVTERLKLGLDVAFINNVAGEEYQFNTELFSFFGPTTVPARSRLDFFNYVLMAWYYPQENVYIGLGAGRYVTRPSQQSSDKLFADKFAPLPNNTVPEGPAFQAVFGYVMKTGSRVRPFAEVKLLYQRQRRAGHGQRNTET
jgi:hypothetical protein